MADLTARLTAAVADRYRIERQLGQGGMALVYLAHDAKHERRVALKLLKPELAAVLGADRFLQEIKVTAHLQHPHILPLHDSGEADGLVFYVMPYIEGESLRDRLQRQKQLAIDEALELTRTVAGALDYAHRQGVIHRDIKPENILLLDGQPMVADFGIALAVSAAAGDTRLTETGLSLGTPHYMSPEQAMGERHLDARSDVYSLAAVLYEMLAGEPPFTGPTVQAIVSRVVTEEPRSLTLQRRTIPPHVEAAVLKALQKLPADRFATAGQFAEALSRPGVVVGPATWRWRGALPWTVAGVAAALGLWIGGAWRAPVSSPPPVARFELAFGDEAQPSDGPGAPIALSPDGSRIVFLGLDAAQKGHLFTRLLDRIDPVPIPGTEGAVMPFFSPDGQWLGFYQDGKLRKVSVAGGAVVTICDLPAMTGASWGSGDVIVFASRGRLYRVPATGGSPTLIAAPDSASDVAFRWPELLPDGRTVVFSTASGNVSHLAGLSLQDTTVRSLDQEGTSPHFVDAGGGYILFGQTDGTLFAAPFDPRRFRFTSPPQPVIDGVRMGPSPVAKLGVAKTGALAFLSVQGGTREIVLATRQGRLEVLALPPARYRNPKFSPDGRRLAFDVDLGSPVTGDIWTYDLAGRTLTRLTFDSSSFAPEWAPDGRRIAFTRRRGVDQDLYWVATDGSGLSDTLVAGLTIQTSPQFTSDGKTLFFAQGETDFSSASRRWDIWVMPSDSPSAARPLLANPFSEQVPRPSPDGRWLAYQANETGTNAVYVRALASGSSGGRVRVSPEQGAGPRWSANGRELFYRRGDSVMVVTVTTGSELSFSSPRALVGGLAIAWGFDVHPSGQRFVWVRSHASDAPSITVLLNWFGGAPR